MEREIIRDDVVTSLGYLGRGRNSIVEWNAFLSCSVKANLNAIWRETLGEDGLTVH